MSVMADWQSLFLPFLKLQVQVRFSSKHPQKVLTTLPKNGQVW